MKEFFFNDCGICLNPNVIEDKKGHIFYKIRTAHTERGWSGACSVGGSTWGASCGVSANDYDEFFPTEQECIKYWAQYAEEQLTREEGDKAKNLLYSLRELIKPQPVQLTLF